MKVYISGPMTGYAEHNFPTFDAAAEHLFDLGHQPLNPAAETGVVDAYSWADYLRADLRLLLDADAVAVLPGWEASRGAVLEVHVAHALGMRVLPIDLWTADMLGGTTFDGAWRSGATPEQIARGGSDD